MNALRLLSAWVTTTVTTVQLHGWLHDCNAPLVCCRRHCWYSSVLHCRMYNVHEGCWSSRGECHPAKSASSTRRVRDSANRSSARHTTVNNTTASTSTTPSRRVNRDQRPVKTTIVDHPLTAFVTATTATVTNSCIARLLNSAATTAATTTATSNVETQTELMVCTTSTQTAHQRTDDDRHHYDDCIQSTAADVDTGCHSNSSSMNVIKLCQLATDSLVTRLTGLLWFYVTKVMFFSSKWTIKRP